MFFSFQTTKKYTKALLDVFNNIQVERERKDKTKEYITVPIVFGSRDYALVFNETEKDQILSGNYQCLPRMSLSLIAIERELERKTPKFNRVNVSINGDACEFQFNSVPYNFDFTLSILARSLTDLTSILEQILPFFNNTMNLKINEFDNMVDPTSIPVELINVQVDLDQEFDLGEIRLCKAELQLKLHGNIYPPINKDSVINKVISHLVPKNGDIVDNENAIDIIVPETPILPVDKNLQIKGIIGSNTIKVGRRSKYLVDTSIPNIGGGLIINVLETDIKPTITKDGMYFVVIGDAVGKIKLEIQAVDRDMKQSNKIEYSIEVV